MNKTCVKCGESKPLEAFYKAKDCKDGRRGDCKSCRKKLERQWYESNRQYAIQKANEWQSSNPERARERKRQWERDNPERVLANRQKHLEKNRDRTRKWKQENPERKRAYDRQWKEKNLDRHKEAKRRWIEENIEYARYLGRTRSAIRRARKLGNAEPITVSEQREWEDSQPKVCAYCGIDCARNYHVDHITPLSKGGAHQIANLAISCPPCNLSKGARDLNEFFKSRA